MTVDLWKGEFGDTYHERNRFAPADVKPLFDKILDGIVIRSVLEVGSGLGHNLMAIDAEYRAGIEPNDSARRESLATYPELRAYDADASALPFEDNAYDLVLTCGLLIHIPPDSVRGVIEEIVRVSSRYVLAIEYAHPFEEMVPYRGEADILWKRPFGKLFVAWGGMKLIKWDDAEPGLYPGCSYWLLEK